MYIAFGRVDFVSKVPVFSMYIEDLTIHMYFKIISNRQYQGKSMDICDCLSENPPSSHLLVF